MSLQNQGEQSQLFREGTSGTDIINRTCILANGQPSCLASDNETLRDNEVSGNQNHTLQEQVHMLVCRLQNLEDELMSEQNRNHVSRQSTAGSAAPPVPSRAAIDPCDPSLTLQTKLLWISDSLTADELKRMKFLAKGKVSGFRLARIREGFELFEELETDGEYPLTFIGQLLERIGRFDLLEKLGLPLSEIVRSADSCRQERDVEKETSPEQTAPTNEISSGSRCNTTSREDEMACTSQLPGNEDIVSESRDAAVAGACAANSEGRKKNSLDSCDGPGTTSNTRMAVLDSEVNSTGNPVHGHFRAQDSSDERNGPPLQQSLLDRDETAEGVSSRSSTDWERLGARPKQGRMQRQPPESMPQEIINPLSDGLAGDFIARHSEDDTILKRLCRGDGPISLFCEDSLHGSPYADRNLSNRPTADWESLDAQPVPRPEIIIPLCAGVTDDCLLRNSKDPTILERIVPQQEAITACSWGMCEHYQHHYCRVRFPCCAEFYPCHHCHNNSSACDNKDVKAHHATHFLCSYCCHEQEVDRKCHRCGRNMSAYVCFNCGHFSCTDEVPYRCEMCGICRIQTENACQDQCCFCLEDAFSSRQWLPCSHTVHRECLLAMIQNNIIACPICRYPLYNPSGW